jgi:hypothetical protein
MSDFETQVLDLFVAKWNTFNVYTEHLRFLHRFTQISKIENGEPVYGFNPLILVAFDDPRVLDKTAFFWAITLGIEIQKGKVEWEIVVYESEADLDQILLGFDLAAQTRSSLISKCFWTGVDPDFQEKRELRAKAILQEKARYLDHLGLSFGKLKPRKSIASLVPDSFGF